MLSAQLWKNLNPRDVLDFNCAADNSSHGLTVLCAGKTSLFLSPDTHLATYNNFNWTSAEI